MRRLTVNELHALKIKELGLDENALDLTTVEAMAAALRRVASYLCPCAPSTLVRNVVQPLRGLVEDFEVAKVVVEETLDTIVAHGDIIELREIDADAEHGARTLLYAAPPGFILRQSGAVILLGIAPDSFSMLPEDIEPRVEYIRHLRRLIPRPGEDLRTTLTEVGLIEFSFNDWLRVPKNQTAAQHLAEIDHLLDLALPSRDIPGLSLLDPARPVRYYRGRWVRPSVQSGRFVARRSQAYGADLWCYVQLRDGNPERLIDFPKTGSRWRGCDEAWRLQMAIDATRGEPQRFTINPGPIGTQVIKFFSPVPMWAQRRWDAIGEPVPSSGCLFAYRLPFAEVVEEARFGCESLWLAS